MDINIRDAEIQDCPAIFELIKELALYEKAPHEVTVNYNHFVECGFGTNPVWFAIVAENNSTVIGVALYYTRYSTWKGSRMYLEDILVTEKFRGHGIGKALFERLLAICSEKKFNGMTWQVLNWNEPAINFYRKFKGVTFDAEWINCAISKEDLA